jgi:hypothetical protein
MSGYAPITVADLGCWIDESHGDAVTLDRRVIAVAVAYGWQLSSEDQAYLDATPNPESDWREQEARAGELAEIVGEIATDAVDFLNGIAPVGLYFEVDDNSLYLRDDSEDGAV